jgi:hypothetical protein
VHLILKTSFSCNDFNLSVKRRLLPRHGTSSGCGWRKLLQDMEDKLNKQKRRADNGQSSNLRLCRGTSKSAPQKKTAIYEILGRALDSNGFLGIKKGKYIRDLKHAMAEVYIGLINLTRKLANGKLYLLRYRRRILSGFNSGCFYHSVENLFF